MPAFRLPQLSPASFLLPLVKQALPMVVLKTTLGLVQGVEMRNWLFNGLVLKTGGDDGKIFSGIFQVPDYGPVYF